MSGLNYNDTTSKPVKADDGVVDIALNQVIPGDYDIMKINSVADTAYPRITFDRDGLKFYSSKGSVQWTLTYEGRFYSPRGVSAGLTTTYDYNSITTNRNGIVLIKDNEALTSNPFWNVTCQAENSGVVHNSMLQVTPVNVDSRALVIKGTSGQNVNFFESRNSNNNVLNSIDKDGRVNASSGFSINRIEVDDDYLILISDVIVAVTDTTEARILTLPSAASCKNGQIFTIIDESGNASIHNITIETSNDNTINGLTNKVINTNYGSLKLYSNGTNAFFII